MKKTMTVLSLTLVSFSVFASQDLKLDSYECGLQVGKSVEKLASTAAAQDAKNLSEDLADYAAQTKLIPTLKGEERDQVLQAQHNTWQSIVYGLNNINTVSPEDAAAIKQACDLQ